MIARDGEPMIARISDRPVAAPADAVQPPADVLRAADIGRRCDLVPVPGLAAPSLPTRSEREEGGTTAVGDPGNGLRCSRRAGADRPSAARAFWSGQDAIPSWMAGPESDAAGHQGEGGGPLGGTPARRNVLAALRRRPDPADRRTGGADGQRSDRPGAPLPDALRGRMESSFGAGFSDVRVHLDSRPREHGAIAVTRGTDVHVSPEAYQPHSTEGQRLLGHELAHVVQQRAGRIRPSGQTAGGFIEDPELEAEADRAGDRAAAGAAAGIPALGSAAAPAGPGHGVAAAIQPKMGFELELEVLVDISGRPVPEKMFLGSYGTERLELQVDHNGKVEGPTPEAPERADFTVATTAPPAVGAPPMRTFGAYDLPQGLAIGGQPVTYEARMAGGAADPRAALSSNHLNVANWATATSGAAFTRPPAPNNVGLMNAVLPPLDKAIRQYTIESNNWQPTQARHQLNRILTLSNTWLASNNTPPSRWHPIDRYTYTSAQDTVTALMNEAQAHLAFWNNPAHANPPVGMARQYRRTVGATTGSWENRHPIAGGGGDRYASILEIVTRPYEPETAPGKLGLITAMTQAVQLAADIETATGNFNHRARLDSIANTNVSNPETYVGNDDPAQLRGPQRTDASIQSTFAIDLSQIPSLMASTIGMGAPQSQFSLKHQADVSSARGERINRAEMEMSLAARNATNVTNRLKARIGAGAPTFVNLRGLLTLICQYLRMGKHFDPGGVQVLDKNLTDLLSRTDLAQIFANAVPNAEKAWKPAHLNWLTDELLTETGRNGGYGGQALFNNPTLNRPLGTAAPFNLTCRQFVTCVFTGPSDGVTPNLGGFQRRPVEDIDPAGARPGGEAHRLAPVFELRNMMPKLTALEELAEGGESERYPRADWVAMATYLADVIDLLNRRTEAQAVRDVRIAENGPGGLTGVAAPPVSPIANW